MLRSTIPLCSPVAVRSSKGSRTALRNQRGSSCPSQICATSEAGSRASRVADRAGHLGHSTTVVRLLLLRDPKAAHRHQLGLAERSDAVVPSVLTNRQHCSGRRTAFSSKTFLKARSLPLGSTRITLFRG